MFSVRRVLRWAGAMVVAVIVYVVVFAVGALMWQKFGGNPVEATKWTIAVATCCAVLAGAFTARREDWKAAALALWLLALLFPLVLLVYNSLSGHFMVLNLFELAGALIGGFPAYYAVRIVPLRTLKTKHAAGQK
jgi:hypothetical protein